MIINGAPIRFRSKARIELTAHARFLFGKQIMSPEAADTPARRLYFALQAAYIGTEEERAQGLEPAPPTATCASRRRTSSAARRPRCAWPSPATIWIGPGQWPTTICFGVPSSFS
jgi:flagellar protein FlbT